MFTRVFLCFRSFLELFTFSEIDGPGLWYSYDFPTPIRAPPNYYRVPPATRIPPTCYRESICTYPEAPWSRTHVTLRKLWCFDLLCFFALLLCFASLLRFASLRCFALLCFFALLCCFAALLCFTASLEVFYSLRDCSGPSALRMPEAGGRLVSGGLGDGVPQKMCPYIWVICM